jgi:hypothetical protein
VSTSTSQRMTIGDFLLRRLEEVGVAHLFGGHCCIEAKGVLAMAQSGKSCSPDLAENYDKPSIRGLLCGF